MMSIASALASDPGGFIAAGSCPGGLWAAERFTTTD